MNAEFVFITTQWWIFPCRIFPINWNHRRNLIWLINFLDKSNIHSLRKISKCSFPMKTDAILMTETCPHWKEYLFLFRVASFKNCCNIFRTRQFLMSKKWFEISFCDGVSSSSTINLSVCCDDKSGKSFVHTSFRLYFHHFIRFPLMRRPLFVNLPCWWVSVRNKFLHFWMLLSPRTQKYLTFVSRFHRTPMLWSNCSMSECQRKNARFSTVLTTVKSVGQEEQHNDEVNDEAKWSEG